jgi:endonuclease YncB( thermonuclease family)
MKFISSFLILFIAIANLAVASSLEGRVTVIDGDTLEMHGKRIRLHGIDAPESGQTCASQSGKTYRCGQLAAKQMAKYTKRKTIRCNVRDTDRYGRLVAVCFADGQDINKRIVRDGFALAYRRFSRDYVAAERNAKRDKVGMWQGAFIKPWDWRGGDRLSKTKEQKGKCVIKGNISSSGKIYHTPSSPWYERTKINTAKGERWFCTEAEAVEAGWRAPKM